MPPASAHLARRMWNAVTAEVASHVLYETAAVVVVQPVFQVMQAREIVACALTTAISVQLDVVKQALGRPIRFLLVEHSREAKCDLEKRPAIHSLKVHRRRLDPVIDFESKMFVSRSNQCLSNCRSSFPNRQRLPIARFSLRDQSIELILTLKNCVKWQSRFGSKCH